MVAAEMVQETKSRKSHNTGVFAFSFFLSFVVVLESRVVVSSFFPVELDDIKSSWLRTLVWLLAHARSFDLKTGQGHWNWYGGFIIFDGSLHFQPKFERSSLAWMKGDCSKQ